jgi:hypothetical protein
MVPNRDLCFGVCSPAAIGWKEGAGKGAKHTAGRVDGSQLRIVFRLQGLDEFFQYEKTLLVAKLKGTRTRKRAAKGTNRMTDALHLASLSCER